MFVFPIFSIFKYLTFSFVCAISRGVPMEVDSPTPWKQSLECAPSETRKFANMKSFVNAAREFEATHSEASIDLMNRSLGLISSRDLSIFSPGRPEVCAFFSTLWRIMYDDRAPRWSAVAVLARAVNEPNMRHALTHTYKFMPVLSRLLSETVSNEKKLKLLSVMQDISYGIKISWQESYLLGLMKQLTKWILQPMSEPQHRVIGHKSLTILVNVCYGNLPAIHALTQTIDTKEFIVHLMNLKDGGYGGVSVCRLLACVSSAVSRAPRPADVHGYIDCTMRTFNKAIIEKDSTQLLHAYIFMNDLCLDTNTKNFVLTYPNFSVLLKDALQEIEKAYKTASSSSEDTGSIESCLNHILKFLTVLMSLDLYELRCHHDAVINISLLSKDVCISESLELFAAVASQYKDENCLSSEIVRMVNEFLAPILDPSKAGLQWLQVVGALCELTETQEKVLSGVSPESFEDILYSVLHYTSQNGVAGMEQSQQAAILGCRIALTLAPLARPWDSALARMLAHHQVRKMLCTSLMSGGGTRRRQVLHLVKHHCFPSDQMNQVFGETSNLSDSQVTLSQNGNGVCAGAEALHAPPPLQASQERAVDRLVGHLSDALQNNQMGNITTSSMMELFTYKMKCLEQRLHSQSVALKGATEHVAALEHTLAMSQAAVASQQDVLYTLQVQNERYNKMVEDLHKQLEDAETTLRGFRAKLAAERLDRDNQIAAAKQEALAQISRMDSEMKSREKEMEARLTQAQEEIQAVQNKLDQQTNKNSELAGVLVKFEERVKQRDRRLEEAAAADAAQRRDIEHRDATIKQLEKTVLERENRLYQVTTQLEEMKRVQEMVAKLMSKSTAGVNGSTS